MKKQETNNKMLKIVYFDELSATDYLIIKKEGITKKIEEQLYSKDKEKNLKVGGDLGAKFPLWVFGIGGGLKGEGNIKLEHAENNILKKTISNSLLSDFINEIDKDDNIIKFKEYAVKPYPNSMTFIKMFTPYLKMITNDIETDGGILKFSNMDAAFEDGKGYYEMVATKENEKYIFRFNINSFRNNYTLSDLTKMNLCYYGIKVGETEEENLDILNELSINENSYNIQLEDIENSSSNRKSSLILQIYDILLAGVDNDGD